MDRASNPLKMAPHTLAQVFSSNWDRAYSREIGAFPAVSLMQNNVLQLIFEKNMFSFSHLLELILNCGQVLEESMMHLETKTWFALVPLWKHTAHHM